MRSNVITHWQFQTPVERDACVNQAQHRQMEQSVRTANLTARAPDVPSLAADLSVQMASSVRIAELAKKLSLEPPVVGVNVDDIMPAKV